MCYYIIFMVLITKRSLCNMSLFYNRYEHCNTVAFKINERNEIDFRFWEAKSKLD